MIDSSCRSVLRMHRIKFIERGREKAEEDQE
jgi:hypothetical protein